VHGNEVENIQATDVGQLISALLEPNFIRLGTARAETFLFCRSCNFWQNLVGKKPNGAPGEIFWQHEGFKEKLKGSRDALVKINKTCAVAYTEKIRNKCKLWRSDSQELLLSSSDCQR